MQINRKAHTHTHTYNEKTKQMVHKHIHDNDDDDDDDEEPHPTTIDVHRSCECFEHLFRFRHFCVHMKTNCSIQCSFDVCVRKWLINLIANGEESLEWWLTGTKLWPWPFAWRGNYTGRDYSTHNDCSPVWCHQEWVSKWMNNDRQTVISLRQRHWY